MPDTYGMKINDSLGATMYDSSSQGGVFVEFATLPVHTGYDIYTVEYPQLVGRNIYVTPLVVGANIFKIYGPQDTPVGYTAPLGYPVIQYKRSAISSIVPGLLSIMYIGYYHNLSILMVFAV